MVLEIDSSRGEGGGQMVRTSVALATLTGTTTRLTRIRENRPTNGLSKQHTTAVNAIAQMTGSKITGNYIGSSELLVEPGDKQVTDISIQAQEILRIKANLNNMLASHCGRSVEDVTRDTDRDNFMSAEEAKAYGLIDEVLLRKK